VCLSPSCDLVPGQKKTGIFKDLSDHMPFLAVRLKPWHKNEVPSDVQSNRYVFLEENGKSRIFCINEPDQARIDCKTFTTNQTGRNACLDDPLEHPTKNISFAKALVAGARECRMQR
jgi:hypothetical protein